MDVRILLNAATILKSSEKWARIELIAKSYRFDLM